jgi:hypothetical protein
VTHATRRSTADGFGARRGQAFGRVATVLAVAGLLASCQRAAEPPPPTVTVPAVRAASTVHAFPAAPAAATAPGARQAPQPPAPPRVLHADFGPARAPLDVRRLADWAIATADPQGRPYIVVDKVHARVWAFEPDGRLRGNAPALLGLARGDDSVPGIGERPIAQIRPEERTTPAGRFEAEMGRNALGEDILWVDYDAAVSMHRVRPLVKAERRLQRLASPTAADNRISYGCINLPAAFYDGVVKPLFAARNGVVYVLPETRSLQAQFGPQFATLVAHGS